MLKQITLFMILLTTGVSAHARGLDISLSDESAQFVYLFDSPIQIGVGGTEIGAGVLFNEADDYLLSLRFLVTGNAIGSNRAIQLGVGVKAYVGELDRHTEESVASVAIGGRFNYVIPSSMPMSVYFEGFIAPNITSFGDNEKLTEVNLGYEVEVAPTTRVYFGYRFVEVELETSGIEVEVDDKAHVGLRVSF